MCVCVNFCVCCYTKKHRLAQEYVRMFLGWDSYLSLSLSLPFSWFLVAIHCFISIELKFHLIIPFAFQLAFVQTLHINTISASLNLFNFNIFVHDCSSHLKSHVHISLFMWFRLFVFCFCFYFHRQSVLSMDILPNYTQNSWIKRKFSKFIRLWSRPSMHTHTTANGKVFVFRTNGNSNYVLSSSSSSSGRLLFCSHPIQYFA